jgi:hypothetical protein
MPEPTSENVPQPEVFNPEVTTTKPKTRFGLAILIGVLSFLFLASLAAAYYFYYQNSKILRVIEGQTSQTATAPTPKPSIDSGPTAKWVTYSDDVKKYSFLYPSNMTLSPYREGQMTGIKLVQIGPTQTVSGRTQTELAEGITLTTLVVPNTDPSTLALQQKQKDIQVPEGDIAPKSTPIIETPIGGTTAQQYSFSDDLNATIVTFIPLGKDTLRVAAFYAGFTTAQTMAYLDQVDQILSTFKFTNSVTNTPTPTTTQGNTLPKAWNYHDFPDANLQIAYPNTWKSDFQTFTSSKLIRFWQGDNPSTSTIQLDIKDSWDNTGNAKDLLQAFVVNEKLGIKAAEVLPPKIEDQKLDRYQTNYFFEYQGKVYVFECVHNWIPNLVNQCQTMVKSISWPTNP